MVSTQEYLSNLTLCSRTSKYTYSFLLNFTFSNFLLKLNKILIIYFIFIKCFKLNKNSPELISLLQTSDSNFKNYYCLIILLELFSNS